MEPVTKAKGELAAPDPEDATATAPVPITRWTSGDDRGDDHRLVSSEVVHSPPDLGGVGIGDDEDSNESSSADVETDAAAAPESANDPGSIDDIRSDDPTYSRPDSFTYSGRLDTATTTWWPAPASGDQPATADSTTGSGEPTGRELVTENETADDEFDPAPATITDEVVDFGRRLRAVPDYRPDDDGDDDRRPSLPSDARILAGRDGVDVAVDLHVTDKEAPFGEPVLQKAPFGEQVLHEDPPAETDQPLVEELTVVQDAGSVETVQHQPEHREPTNDGEGAPRRTAETTVDATPGHDGRDLDAAVGHLEAASYADRPQTPMIDLRDRSSIEPKGVSKAIRAGEHQVIETLIRQGMLSTSGPITDRDVRTMVYVAFTSNELRKLILAGGRPDTERADLELGPVELFDERRFAPTPRTLYTRPEPSAVELSPVGAELAGDTSDVECEPSMEGELDGTAMPAPRHLYRLGSDSSPETVA